MVTFPYKYDMPLTHCTHWIFDMDGTLTMPIHDFDAIRRDLGIPLGTPILEYIADMPADEAVRIKQQLDDMEMELASAARAQPGIESVLTDLQEKGCQLGILTRNGEGIAKATLDACGLRGYFPDETIIGREICLPKPLPDGVLYLLNLWQADPGLTVMVGDYLYDIEAGKKAGVNTVHFDVTDQYAWPEFTDHGVSAMRDIKGLF